MKQLNMYRTCPLLAWRLAVVVHLLAITVAWSSTLTFDLSPLPAKYRPPGHPPRALGGEGGRGRRGRLRHRHGDTLRQPDRELLLRRAGNPDGSEEVSSDPVSFIFYFNAVYSLL